MSEQVTIQPERPTEPTDNKRPVPARGIWTLFLGCLSLIPLSMVVGWFDTTTELFPTHPMVDQACLAGAAICGLVAAGTAIYLSKRLTVIQRIIIPLVIMIEAAIGVFLITNHAASVVEGWLDFPTGKTHTRQAMIQISRAYQTHGKGGSQYIQTMPVWSNLEITQQDLTFMRNHRRAGDDGHNPDEISSQGYFCAKVTIEETESAVRVLYSGSHKLPEGTVTFCPALNRTP